MAGHKWWRVINIVKRTTAINYHTIAELNFLNNENIVFSNLNNIVYKDTITTDLNANGSPQKAFDNDPSTIYATAVYESNPEKLLTAYIGCQFDVPVNVTQIQLQMRQDMSANLGFEWQTASVEYSDDGVNWQFYGIIQPYIAQMDLSLKTVDIITADMLNLTPTTTTTALNIYTQNEQGSITGSVKETGLPANCEVALSDRKTRQLIAITRSENYIYSFKGLDINREYYVHGIDDDRSCNAVTQDMLPLKYLHVFLITPIVFESQAHPSENLPYNLGPPLLHQPLLLTFETKILWLLHDFP